jgi:sulfur relay (sulfurtransferase) DsrF/TusC family protein
MKTLREFWRENLKGIVTYSAIYSILKTHGILDRLVNERVLSVRGIKRKTYIVVDEKRFIEILKEYGYWTGN